MEASVGMEANVGMEASIGIEASVSMEVSVGMEASIGIEASVGMDASVGAVYIPLINAVVISGICLKVELILLFLGPFLIYLVEV